MKLLVAEDDKIMQRFLEKKLKIMGHSVTIAQNGLEAWENISSNEFDLLITDWMMPEMDGFELCQKVRQRDFDKYIYIILITTNSAKDDVILGLQAGADDYIIKPFEISELMARLDIGSRIVELKKKLKRKYDDLRKNYVQTIRLFTGLIEVYNEELGRHSKRVTDISLQIAKMHPDIPEDLLELVETVGMLHDIGMIGFPKDLLGKKLLEMNSDEKKHYFAHPVQGEAILKEVEFLRPIAKIVRNHHEQVNGRGFPDGINGNSIPLIAKIIAVADTYDYLIHRDGVSMEKLPEKIQMQKGYQLDPGLVDLLLEIHRGIIVAEKSKHFHRISINELQAGMCLANDIRMTTGALVMPVKTELNNDNIEKLLSYYGQDCISDTVFIFKPACVGEK